jgi:high affinity sulfate transporter 1
VVAEPVSTIDATPPPGSLSRLAPGLAMLRGYQIGWLRYDLPAGLSVAAVALPIAIAYSQLAGFPPVVGLYASILPLVVYAVLGTSRQLIVNPDAATCAMVAAIVAPLAGGDAALYSTLAVSLAVLTGVACVIAGFFRLGFLADFLGKPVLVGFMNGIAISIVIGQIGKVFGFSLESGRVMPRLIEFASKLEGTHLLTLAIGVTTFAVMRGVRRFFPRLPAPLVALVVAVALVELFGLDHRGVAVLGAVPAGLPDLRWTPVPAAHLGSLVSGAAGLALVSFTSGMITARSFAARNRYEIDVDREFIALGACNIAAGVSQGFAVTGADSRTAISDVMGGKTQVTGLVAAATMALVLLFLTGPLQYLPISALGAVLIAAALGLFDWWALVRLYRIHEGEFAVCLTAMLGVVTFGALQGIVLAIALAMLVLLIRSSRPGDAVLGRVDGRQGFFDVADHEGATALPGLVLYRFNASVIFYNAPYFKRRVLAVAASNPGARWLIVDGAPIVHLDSTGADTIAVLADDLASRGIRLAIGGVLPQVRLMLERSGALERLGADAVFPTLRTAVEACESSLTIAKPGAGVIASRSALVTRPDVRGEQT